jgi:hypothetical protein
MKLGEEKILEMTAVIQFENSFPLEVRHHVKQKAQS